MYYVYADDEILFDPSCMDGSFTILNPTVTKEMGKAGSFEFSLPVTNVLYGKLKPLATKVAVYSDDKELFRGRILSEDRDFNNYLKYNCEGLLAYLNDTVQPTRNFKGTVSSFLEQVLAYHNSRCETEKQFKLGMVTVDDKKLIISGVSEAESGKFSYEQIYINSTSTEWNTPLDLINSDVINYVGGYLRVRYENGINYLDVLADDYGTTASQDLEFGSNITSLSVTETAEELFTVLIPIGDSNLTIKSVNNGSDELQDNEMVTQYGRIVRSHVFENVTSPSILKDNGLRYLKSNCKKPVEIVVNAVDLSLAYPDVEAIHVGDRVHIYSAPHCVDDTYACTRITYNLAEASSSEYCFGTNTQSLTQKYREQYLPKSGGTTKKKEDDVEQMFQDFYDAYVHYDEGYINMGAIYKQGLEAKQEIKDVIYILENSIGLNMEAKTATFSASVTSNTFDSMHKEIASNSLSLEGVVKTIDDIKTSVMELSASAANHTDTMKAFAATLGLEASEDGASITLSTSNANSLAGKFEIVSKLVNGHVETLTNIDSTLTTINGKLKVMDELLAKKITAEKIDADGIHVGNSLIVNGTVKTALVSLQGDNGRITGNGKSELASLDIGSSLTVKHGASATFNAPVDFTKSVTFTELPKYNKSNLATQSWVSNNYRNKEDSIPWSNISSKPSMYSSAAIIRLADGSTKRIQWWSPLAAGG